MATIYVRNKTYHCDFQCRGRRYRLSLHTTSRREAQRRLKDLFQKVKAGRYAEAGEQNDVKLVLGPEPITCRDFFIQYLKIGEREKSSSTHLVDQYRLQAFLRWLVGKGILYLHDVTTQNIEAYLSDFARTRTRSTVNRELQLIKACFRRARQLGHIKEDPASALNKIKVPRKEMRTLARKEIEKLLRVCDDFWMPRIMGALHTGLRKGEYVNLQVLDVDFELNIMKVVNRSDSERTKNAEPRYLPIDHELRPFLHDLCKDKKSSDHVFSSRSGNRFDARALLTQVKALFKKAGIEGANFHTFRHTYISQLAMTGLDPLTLQELAGHKDIATTRRYLHFSPEHLKQAQNRLTFISGREKKN